MFTQCFRYVKRQWRQVTGALAVLLMFMVPATRAALAGGNNSSGDYNHNQNDNNQNSQNQASKASCSTPKPVSPVNPSSKTANCYGKPGEK